LGGRVIGVPSSGGGDRLRARDELGELAQVLDGGDEVEFVALVAFWNLASFSPTQVMERPGQASVRQTRYVALSVKSSLRDQSVDLTLVKSMTEELMRKQ
jgi:hypothetical protein